MLTDNSLWENSSLFGGDHWRNLSPAGTILSASAITDAGGNDVVYAITSDHHLWEHSPANGWAMLSSGSFQTVSAGLNTGGAAVVYGVLTDNSLWQNNPVFGGDHWRNLSPAGTVLSASAGGSDEVFAITSDHHLWQHSLLGWSQTSADSFQLLSGNAGAADVGEVFAGLTDGSLAEYKLPFVGPLTRFGVAPIGILAVSAPRHA